MGFAELFWAFFLYAKGWGREDEETRGGWKKERVWGQNGNQEPKPNSRIYKFCGNEIMENQENLKTKKKKNSLQIWGLYAEVGLQRSWNVEAWRGLIICPTMPPSPPPSPPA